MVFPSKSRLLADCTSALRLVITTIAAHAEAVAFLAPIHSSVMFTII